MATHINYAPQELNELVQQGSVFLVDVREAHEYASGHIADAILFPLSTFDPAQLPDAQGKPLVFYCAGGVRSMHAIAYCTQAGLAHNAHLAGGIKAWATLGLPIQK